MKITSPKSPQTKLKINQLHTNQDHIKKQIITKIIINYLISYIIIMGIMLRHMGWTEAADLIIKDIGLHFSCIKDEFIFDEP